MTNVNKRKLSELLEQILAKHTGDRVSLKALAHDLHKQGMPLLMAIFVIPMCLPIPYPPGFSTAIAVSIAVCAIQLLIQRKELWLPEWFAARSISHALIDKIIEKALPKIKKSEHLFKERWENMVDARAQKAVAVIILVLNIVIATPVPGIHFFPGWAIAFMCLGLLYRDGKVVALGMVLAVWGLIFGWAEIYLGEKAIRAIVHHWQTRVGVAP